MNLKLVDVRSIETYLGAHIPNSFCLPVSIVTAYAGWLFDVEDQFIIMANSQYMAKEKWTLLDVRKVTEYVQLHSDGSENAFLGHLADKKNNFSGINGCVDS